MRLRWTLITTASALAPRRQPRSLGQTDIETRVPLGIGTWQAGNRLLYDYSPARDAALLEAWSSAAAAGVSYFDSGDSYGTCLLYTSPSPRDLSTSRMPSSA